MNVVNLYARWTIAPSGSCELAREPDVLTDHQNLRSSARRDQYAEPLPHTVTDILRKCFEPTNHVAKDYHHSPQTSKPVASHQPRVFTKAVASAVLFSFCELGPPRQFAKSAKATAVACTAKNARFLRCRCSFETFATLSRPDRLPGTKSKIGGSGPRLSRSRHFAAL